ncbi:MAG: glycosyltransferase [Beijerinckiaceae bacterium]|nr:glycosyltransferase [Beijerinckiaceae bacterium]
MFRHVIDLTKEQIARGHDVGLVADELTGGDRARDTLEALLPQLKLGVMRLPIRRSPHPSDLVAQYKVHAHAHRLGVDVVHGHGSKGGVLARLPGFIQHGISPLRCYTPHGGSFNYVANPLIQAAYMGVEKLLAARTDVFLFESVFIAQRFHQKVGGVEAIIRIVQNGIGLSELVPVAPHADAADFLYVGELRSAKGIDTLIEATATLSRRRTKPCKLILVGAGPDQAELMRQAASLGIADQVSFPGAMPAREAFALGRTLVVPSRAESLPYIVLEAAGAQMPMIATDVGGIGEVFGPFRDQLIPCDDVDILAARMGHMLEIEPARTRQQAEDLAAFVATRFTIAKMADAVIAGYRDGLARRAAAAGPVSRSFAIPN